MGRLISPNVFLHVLIPLLLPDQVQNKKDKDGHESVGGDQDESEVHGVLLFFGVMLDTLCNVRAMWMPGPHDHYGSEQTSILVRRLEFCCVGTMLGLPAHEEGWMESNAIPLESRVIHLEESVMRDE
ncbi:MAG: hypothetical protein Q8N04_09485 [Nitrospira sp.]|nr:hypothetical protein [Nitrospira sp.]